MTKPNVKSRTNVALFDEKSSIMCYKTYFSAQDDIFPAKIAISSRKNRKFANLFTHI